MSRPLVALMALMLAAGPLSAKSLRDDPMLDQGLFTFAVAYELQKKCDAIKPRILRALGFQNKLKRRARELGFSDRAVEDHIENEAEKALMQDRVDAYLSQNGVALNSPQSYCEFGKSEIARNSQSGRLLKAR